jgi:hypothetical protein
MGMQQEAAVPAELQAPANAADALAAARIHLIAAGTVTAGV